MLGLKVILLDSPGGAIYCEHTRKKICLRVRCHFANVYGVYREVSLYNI